MLRPAVLVAAALLVSVPSALPSAARAEKLTPERAFADPDINGPTARGVQISPDGRFVTFLRAKPDDQTVQDLWALPIAGGEPRRLIDSTALEPKGQELSEAEKARRERQRISARGIVEYKWDEEGRSILVPAGGDLYLASAADGSVRRLTQTPGDEIDGKFSRHGRYVGYVRDQNLYVNDLAKDAGAGGGERALTHEGHGTLSLRRGRVRGAGGDGALHRLLVQPGRGARGLHPRGRERGGRDPPPGHHRHRLHHHRAALSPRRPTQRGGRPLRHGPRARRRAREGRPRRRPRRVPRAGELVGGRTRPVRPAPDPRPEAASTS